MAAHAPSSCSGPRCRVRVCKGWTLKRRSCGSRAVSEVAPLTCATHGPMGTCCATLGDRSVRDGQQHEVGIAKGFSTGDDGDPALAQAAHDGAPARPVSDHCTAPNMGRSLPHCDRCDGSPARCPPAAIRSPTRSPGRAAFDPLAVIERLGPGPGRSHLDRRARRAADDCSPARRLRRRRPAPPAGGVTAPAVRVPGLPGCRWRPAAAPARHAALSAPAHDPGRLIAEWLRDNAASATTSSTSCASRAAARPATWTTGPRCRGRPAAGTTARTWADAGDARSIGGQIAISRREGTQRVWDLCDPLRPEADDLPDEVVAIELLDRQLRAKGITRMRFGDGLH